MLITRMNYTGRNGWKWEAVIRPHGDEFLLHEKVNRGHGWVDFRKVSRPTRAENEMLAQYLKVVRTTDNEIRY